MVDTDIVALITAAGSGFCAQRTAAETLQCARPFLVLGTTGEAALSLADLETLPEGTYLAPFATRDPQRSAPTRPGWLRDRRAAEPGEPGGSRPFEQSGAGSASAPAGPQHDLESGRAFVQAHAADIASFAAGAAVFIGCEALTAGVGTIGCAAAAGAVGSLVS